MNLLLDTCSFLWALQNPRMLSSTARRALQRSENEVSVNVVSFWEISIKFALGKLPLEGATPGDMPQFAIDSGFTVTTLSPEIAATLARLPLDPEHRDPFDRMLVWIAIQEDLHFVSGDDKLSAYESAGLKICW